MWRANLGLLFTVFTWGSMIPAVNHMVANGWDPFFLTSSRYVVAAPVFLLVLALAEPLRGLGRDLGDWRAWLLGLMGIGFFGPLLIVGIAYANPITAAVLSAAAPAVNCLVAWSVFREPIPRAMLPALALTVIGGIVATYNPTAGGAAFHLRGGEILILAATAIWAWYSLAAQRWMQGSSQLRITTVTMTTGAIASVAVFLGFGLTGVAPLPPALLTGADDIALFAWMTAGPVIGGFFLWHYGVRALGIAVASPFVNLTAVFAILLTAAILGIHPTPLQLTGGAIVIVGVLQSQLRHLPIWRRLFAVAK